MIETHLKDFVKNASEKQIEWKEFLARNDLSPEQKSLVLETLGLLAILKDICQKILREGNSPSTKLYLRKLNEAVELLIRVHIFSKDRINGDNLPGLPF